MPFIDELLSCINTIICDLQPQQVSSSLMMMMMIMMMMMMDHYCPDT